MALFSSGKPEESGEPSPELSFDLLYRAVKQLADGDWHNPIGQNSKAADSKTNLIFDQLERLRQQHLAQLDRMESAGGSVQRSSIELSQTSQDLFQEIATFSAALKSLSEDAIEQSELANTLDRTLESISQEAADHQRLARDAETTSEQIREDVATGDKRIDGVLRGWEDTISNLKASDDDIKAFDETAREIASIVEIISEIAHRTNVLSLNASLEAERSGDEGQAFSVLATEIRGLSDNVKREAGGIDGLIQEFLNRQSSLLSTLRNGIADLDQGAKAVATVRTSLSETVEGIELVALRIVRLATGFARLADRISLLQEQARNVANISNKHADVTKQTVSQTRDRMLVGADQMLHEAKNLARVSGELHETFKRPQESEPDQ